MLSFFVGLLTCPLRGLFFGLGSTTGRQGADLLRAYFVLPLAKTAEGIDLRGRDLSQRKISSSKLLCTDKNADSQNAVGVFVGFSPSPMVGLKSIFSAIVVLLYLATRTGGICTTLRGSFLFRTTFGVRHFSPL